MCPIPLFHQLSHYTIKSYFLPSTLIMPDKLTSLREAAALDHALLKTQMLRLAELREMDPKDIKTADRNQIINWSRSSITEYVNELDAMEVVPNPTTEEKQCMYELNRLVSLGDELVDLTRELREQLNAKFQTASKATKKAQPLKKDMPKQSVPKQQADIALEKDHTVSTDTTKQTSNSQNEKLPLRSTAGPQRPATTQPQNNTSPQLTISRSQNTLHLPTSAKYDTSSSSSGSKSKEEDPVDPTDTRGIYAILGLPHTAEMSVIRSAIRKKKMELYPERNTDDPEAADKFSNFVQLSDECLGNESKREAYDQLSFLGSNEKETERVDVVTARIKQLKS
ncbi:Hypothetical protein R9X50_00017700 [Acrodontium crateriforme]|uniref:J domain-containing protein n=1 Tax=Acrodontium crateriforme TaxID=150365 RepID=A0AAQ3R8Z7_9PEZI|nr:Hypothetical protein R9X50_00017700 [Acrodontium crateriforme]